MLVTDGGQLIRVPVEGISIMGRSTQGVIVFDTAEDERVVSVEHIPEVENGNGDDGSADGGPVDDEPLDEGRSITRSAADREDRGLLSSVERARRASSPDFAHFAAETSAALGLGRVRRELDAEAEIAHVKEQG